MAKAMKRLGELSQDELLDDYYVALERARKDRVDREAYVREEGEKKGREELILSMLKNNLAVSLISKITGLSQQEIKKFKKL